MVSLEDLLNRLRLRQSDSDNPRSFEKDIAEAFSELGFKAVGKGGQDDCDVLVYHRDHVVVIDAKTTNKEVISEGYVNFEGIDRYKENYKTQAAAIVAKGFSEGNIRKTAEKKGVVLIETEALCKALENNAIYRYNLDNLYENLFCGRKVVTSNDIEQSTKPSERQISILSRIFEVFTRREQIDINELYHHFQYSGIDFSRDEIKEALGILCTPPLSILCNEESRYQLCMPLDEVKKILGIVFSALKLEKLPNGKDREGKVPPDGKVKAGDFEHERDGIYHLKDNPGVKIDVSKPSRDVEASLKANGLSVTSMNNFYYALRKKAGLIK